MIKGGHVLAKSYRRDVFHRAEAVPFCGVGRTPLDLKSGYISKISSYLRPKRPVNIRAEIN